MDAVQVALFDPLRQRVLLTRRIDIPVWVLPGGGIETDESPEEAAKRECLEETGLSIAKLRLVGTYFPTNRLTRKTFLFEAQAVEGVLKLSPEVSAIAFFDLHFLPKHIPPPYLQWIAQAKASSSSPIQAPLTGISYLLALQTFLKHPLWVGHFLWQTLFK